MSEEALIHLRTYKYHSIDESFISNYILKHYVCSPQVEDGPRRVPDSVYSGMASCNCCLYG